MSGFGSADEKIMKAVARDECLQERIKDAVKAAIERELEEADVIEKCEEAAIGCVSVLFTLVCTA